MKLAFATGRHFASVQQAIAEHALPLPEWIICDVGTSIYKRSTAGTYLLSEHFADHLANIMGGWSIEQLREHLLPVARLRLQEGEKQTPFKLSYYTEAQSMAEIVSHIQQLLATHALPFSVIASVDPFTNEGLIDLLPRDSSKAYALNWWSLDEGLEHHEIVYAGDSGNDSAAFAAGYRSIIVGNAASHVLREAERAHAAAGWSDRIFAASKPATSGVLEGLLHFASGG